MAWNSSVCAERPVGERRRRKKVNLRQQKNLAPPCGFGNFRQTGLLPLFFLPGTLKREKSLHKGAASLSLLLLRVVNMVVAVSLPNTASVLKNIVSILLLENENVSPLGLAPLCSLIEPPRRRCLARPGRWEQRENFSRIWGAVLSSWQGRCNEDAASEFFRGRHRHRHVD